MNWEQYSAANLRRPEVRRREPTRIAEFDNVRGQRERFDRVTFDHVQHPPIHPHRYGRARFPGRHRAVGRTASQNPDRPRGRAAGILAPAHRSEGQGRDAAERHPLLHPRQSQAREARRAAARRKRRLGAREREPTRPRALRRAHGVQRDDAFQPQRSREVPAVHRCTLRRGPQRLHELRRDRLHPADSDRHGAHRGPGVHDPRGLGARAAVRLERSRGRAQRRARGVAARERGERSHAAPVAADRAARIALRRASTDRQRAEHHDGDAGARPVVLQDVVSAGPSGRDRGRRLRSRGDRGGDQEALRRNSQGGESDASGRRSPCRPTRNR